MKLSIIISTYNSEEWLHKVLLGYSVQTFKDFEIIVADDGSKEFTKKVVDSFQSKFKHPIKYVWQEDIGFRKCKILNEAIVNSASEYLIFTDGDCIPRKDFVSQHNQHKQKGYFLSGGYFKLPMLTSKSINDEDIINGNCFSVLWLLKKGLKFNFKISKLLQNNYFIKFMNLITPTKRSWNGHNSSCYKSDIEIINGFNELLSYGGEDREFGERLYNLGVKSKQIRYSAICIHLDHDRSYVDLEKIKFNREIRKFNKINKVTRIEHGIDKH